MLPYGSLVLSFRRKCSLVRCSVPGIFISSAELPLHASAHYASAVADQLHFSRSTFLLPCSASSWSCSAWKFLIFLQILRRILLQILLRSLSNSSSDSSSLYFLRFSSWSFFRFSWSLSTNFFFRFLFGEFFFRFFFDLCRILLPIPLRRILLQILLRRWLRAPQKLYSALSRIFLNFENIFWFSWVFLPANESWADSIFRGFSSR